MPTTPSPDSLPDLDPRIASLLSKDKQLLETTDIPIITVSASFKEDLREAFGLSQQHTTPDVVFSRAHYSMALAILIAAWGKVADPSIAWCVDPTNYVSQENWGSIELTELVGKTLARHSWLKMAKDFIDRFGRQRLPILSSITPPLIFLTENIHCPILSMHIAAGNILLEQGKAVVQVITDPHVRDDYLMHAGNPKLTYCVFDDATKKGLLKRAKELHKKLPSRRVIVTGPPVDPRIVKARAHKKPWHGERPLRLCITTGGLGTNKDEIAQLLDQLLPVLKQTAHQLQVLVYTSTHRDLMHLVKEKVKQYRTRLGSIDNPDAELRLLHHPQIVDANELLIHYGFPWADGFVTKPSGDMAYDAAAAGCFLLTLAEWGAWENNVRQVFEERNVAKKADVHAFVQQLNVLSAAQPDKAAWITEAMHSAEQLPLLFLKGAPQIVAAYHRVFRAN